MIIPWHDPDLFQLQRVHVQGNVEIGEGIDPRDRIFHRGPAQVGEINGILGVYDDKVITIRIRGRAPAGSGHYTDGLQGPGLIHIIYRAS